MNSIIFVHALLEKRGLALGVSKCAAGRLVIQWISIDTGILVSIGSSERRLCS